MVEKLASPNAGPDAFEVAVYETDELFSQRGDTPADVVAKYMADSLGRIGVEYRIYYRFASIPIDNTQTVCDDFDAKDEWAEWAPDNAPFVAADSNILLVHVPGGGCGDIGGDFCASGALSIDEERDDLVGTGPWYGSVYAAMHEVGHNMGWSHNPHPGNAFVTQADPRWHKTPCVGAREAITNMCGQQLDADPDVHTEDLLVLDYHSCVAEHIQIDTAPVTEVVNLDASTDIHVGETVQIEVDVVNHTPVDEDVVVNVTVDRGVNRPEETIATISDTVLAQGNLFADVEWTPESDGTYTIRAGEAEIEREVTVGGSVSVTELSVTPAEPVVGEPATVSVSAENTMPESATRSYSVIADQGVNAPEEDVGVIDLSIPANGEATGTAEWAPGEATSYTVRVEGEGVSTDVDVREPANGSVQIESITLPGGTPREGEPAQVTVTATNPGNAPATRSVTVSSDPGGSIETVSFDLDPGATADRTVTWTPTGPGMTTLSAGSASVEVVVEPGPGEGPGRSPIDIGLGEVAAAGIGLWLLIGKPDV